jgi:hypothetical protein
MRYSLLAIGFIMMSSNVVIGSALMDEEKNAQIEKQIFKKASQTNFDVSSLAKEEKEWLYETELLASLRSSEEQQSSDSEDTSRALAELARFYDYKQRPDLANRRYVQRAEQDLKDALNGAEAVLSMFNNLINNKLLEDGFFKEIINIYSEDSDNFAKGNYKNLIKEEGFKDHVASLAGAYKNSGKKTLQKRKESNIPPIPLYDDVLKLILEERINKTPTNQ